MILLAVIALATLAANGAGQLRLAAAGFLAVSLTATWIAWGTASGGQLAVAGCAGLVAAALLYVAAGDGGYGEEPGWRLWAATMIAAAATPAAFASFRTITDATQLPLLGPDAAGVTVQVAAFWLLSSGVAILLTARSAVRTSLGALLMITGVQLLVRLVGGSQLTFTLLFAWLEVVIALVGAFLVVNERAAREA
ncbi:MAG: hypothetical protein ACR2G8_05360 [Candidatus Limnocylindria bacterium]